MFEVTVTVKDKRFKGQAIQMDMEQYKDFIRGQAAQLGILEEDDGPIYLVGFDEELNCKGCEFSS